MDVPNNIARYQVLNHLEAGGMGSVFLARDPAIDRLVAIKLLREGFDSEELRERFMREARAAGRLHHVNIVTIFDVGEHNQQPFIAMEYVEGETLHGLIKRKAPLSIGRKIQLMDELAAGLHYAHRGGIVHRDIKPKNVMLDAEGVLKLLDFGIARVSDAGQGGLKTQAGMLMGTLNYMAPEQMMGLPDVDARADQFSAGAVFYELLVCRQAFPGGLESGILHKIINIDPEPLMAIDPALDRGLVDVVNRCLLKSRDNRYPDMAAVRRDLAAVRRRLGVDDYFDTPLPATLPPSSGPAPNRAVDRSATPRPARRDSNRQEEIDRLRASQIREYLDEAKRALDTGDYTAALDASQRALILKEDDPNAIEYEHRARTGRDQREARRLLTDAQAELDRGALTAASALVGRAESLSPASREAAAIREQLEGARRALQEQAARARALEAAIAQARQACASGLLDVAAISVDEALKLDATNAEAIALRAELTRARQRQADESRARDEIAAARDQFAGGLHADAITRLQRFAPPALVADALAELRLELTEIDRLRADAARRADAQRQAEAERQADARRKLEADARRAADERRAAEQRRLAEERRAADARQAAELRPADATIVLPRPPARDETPGAIGVGQAQAGHTSPAPSPLARYAGIGGALLVVLALAAWKSGMFGTAAPVVLPSGSVALDIAPWANIDAITAKSDGIPASGGCTVTPCVLTLPAGAYHVRASNPNFPGVLEFDIAVDADSARQVRQTMPGFRIDDEVGKVLDK